LYDEAPFPTDSEFANKSSPFYYPDEASATLHFIADHVPAIGPTFYITNGVRVRIEDVISSGFVDFIYYGGRGHGQGSVRNIQGWGYGRFVTVEMAEDVLSFENLRFIINAGPHCLGAKPSAAICEAGKPDSKSERCRGNFTMLPAIVALQSNSVGLWLGRADGYRLTGSFFFGTNTAVRLGFAPGAGTELRNPVTGILAADPASGIPGALSRGTGPWGSISQLMVDQAQIGIHMVRDADRVQTAPRAE
jgi:hypothetical protein